MEKFQHDLFRVIYAVLRDQKEAEDATQEVFLKIYYSLPKYEHKGLKTWMTRIAVNHAIDMQRKRKRRREEMVDDFGTSEELLIVKGPSLESEVITEEQRQLVHKKLQELPDNYREVICGFYIEEKSYQQMAAEQNVQVKTIETKLYRARQWIKKHWKEDDFL